MCGIIGFVGSEDSVNYLIDGLSILENRGYDSAGIATIGPDKKLYVSKFASRGTSDAITTLKEHAGAHAGHTIGIGHTRWATHGGKTDANAHPHVDAKNRVAVVHNGVIENYQDLRSDLQSHGVHFTSETDTEVVAQLIGKFLDDGLKLPEAVKSTLQKLEGTWGIGVLSPLLPDTIITARNGSPIVIGLAPGKAFIASEPAAFGMATRDFISLQNGEMAFVRADGSGLDLTRIEKAPDDIISASPAPFPHWTIKEILEQPEAVKRTLNHGARIKNDTSVKLGGLESRSEELLSIKHLVIAACGTSYHAGLYGALAMRAMKSFDTVQVVDASELTPHHFPSQGAGLLVISQSGETKDVHRAVMIAENAGIPSFSIVNAVGSLIARSTKCGVYLNAGREHAVASTKAFVTQVTALELVAIWFADKRDMEVNRRRTLIEDLRRLPTNIQMAFSVRAQCQAIASTLMKADHMFVLGKGVGEPIAREGALKIKEIAYLHAEGYPGGALKHGPFALITEGTPVILLILNDKHSGLMKTAGEEVRARGARNIIITDTPAFTKGIADPNDVIVIPPDGVLTGLLATVPLQFIAYELAVLKGINPDKPRNLAKAVTVD
ncbi:MAG: glutamine--fructose-6-phosphate transaminase (isomerizing) [Patescibacteria group bacterium]|jgi:glucosamine--fructose-6-phosphate aminotransferase (isomerizing)